MKNNSTSKNKKVYRFGIFILFLVCGLLVFLINLTFTDAIPQKVGLILKIGLVVLFLTSSILLYRNKHLEKYWKVFFAFFVASMAIFLSLYLSNWGLRILNLKINTLNGITIDKLLEDLVIIVCIMALIKISRDDMSSIYMTKGNLRLGLIIGVISFSGLFLVTLFLTSIQNISFATFISLTPSILIIALADGFMEELLFRGLFLKRFEPFVGAKLSILLTALIYSLAHLQVTFTPNLPIFLIATFFLGLLWAYIIQKTGSILGAALFHAGVDTLIVLDFLASYGAIQ
ncbi:MAG: CPBP family intramembrane glutamic endopeptidase [Acidobacteriota bacterium]